jgi:hypothetical protein
MQDAELNSFCILTDVKYDSLITRNSSLPPVAYGRKNQVNRRRPVMQVHPNPCLLFVHFYLTKPCLPLSCFGCVKHNYRITVNVK